jgi:hypothetical protein
MKYSQLKYDIPSHTGISSSSTIYAWIMETIMLRFQTQNQQTKQTNSAKQNSSSYIDSGPVFLIAKFPTYRKKSNLKRKCVEKHKIRREWQILLTTMSTLSF